MIAAFLMFVAATASAAAPKPEGLAVQAVHNFGTCVVSRSPDGAARLLAMDFNSRAYDDELRRFMRGHDYCMPFDATLGSSRLVFAGALAEAMVKSDVRSDELPQRLAFDPRRAVIPARSVAEGMALCTALYAPKATATLFDTVPATPEEGEAMKPLAPVLGECLKKDAKVELNKPAIRSLLALAAYRIVTTPKAAQ